MYCTLCGHTTALWILAALVVGCVVGAIMSTTVLCTWLNRNRLVLSVRDGEVQMRPPMVWTFTEGE